MSYSHQLIVLLSVAATVSLAYKDKKYICRYNFTVSYGYSAPDNFNNSRAILINGQFPGPTIHCKPWHTLIVNVINLLDHGFAMHWHGLQQKSSKNADGVPGVTQQLIPVNGSYCYVINLNGQHGTYAYHSHTRLDIIWALGALIIDDTHLTRKYRIKYDCDIPIIISQCWHRDVQDLYAKLVGAPLQLPPASNSVLLNGRSYGNWSTNNSNTDGYAVFNVKRGQTCRFRFISLTDDRAVLCYIEGHNMTVIEADGFLTKQCNTTYVQCNVLERVSVLVHMNQPIGNYMIRCYYTPGSSPDNGVAILHYKGASDPTPMRTVVRPNTVVANQTLGRWVLDCIQPVPQPLLYRCPTLKDVCEEIIISAPFNVAANGSGRFLINNESLITSPAVPYLQQIENGKDISLLPAIVTLKLGCAYLIVIQNLPLGTFCAQHPWHLHGNSFYVVGSGPDEYIPSTDRPIIERNIDNNVVHFKDIFTVFPNTTNATNTQYCGWTAIMLIANNPGVWLTHCHISDHMLIGKQFIIYIKDYECSKSGTFRDPSDCKKYIPCVKDMCGQYYQFPRLTCPRPLFYSERTYSCERIEKVPECAEQDYFDPYNPHKWRNPDNYCVAYGNQTNSSYYNTIDTTQYNTGSADTL